MARRGAALARVDNAYGGVGALVLPLMNDGVTVGKGEAPRSAVQAGRPVNQISAPGVATADTAKEPSLMENGFSSMITQVLEGPGRENDDAFP